MREIYLHAMAHEITLDGQTLVASKEAAQRTGYAQDYIGQLARGGQIVAQRVGGLWYVSLDSLERYKRNAESVPQMPPTPSRQRTDVDSIVTLEGKDYISAARASKLTGYNQDYIGQLARKGTIFSRQIGNRWYVDRESLIAHKQEKDRMLGTVQAESVGLSRPTAPHASYTAQGGPSQAEERHMPLMTYVRDERDLIPQPRRPDGHRREGEALVSPVQIRKINSSDIRPMRGKKSDRQRGRTGIRASGKSMFKGVKVAAVLTVVVMLSYGIVTLKDSARYAALIPEIGASSAVTQSASVAAVRGTMDRIAMYLEPLVTEELVYVRTGSVE
jgi:hypothetical protein